MSRSRMSRYSLTAFVILPREEESGFRNLSVKFLLVESKIRENFSFGIRNPSRLESRIKVPLKKAKKVLEPSARNPESKTFLVFLTWGK